MISHFVPSPLTPTKDIMNSPFKFLDPYTAKDKRVFFGRERETEELYHKLMMTSLLLVYGLSGAGKTSLVRCGLAKRFRGPDWHPLYIRREEDVNKAVHRVLEEKAGAIDGDHYQTDLEKIYEQLNSGGEEAIIEIAEPQEALSGNLAEAIDRLYAKHLRPIYLIFDQFEEIFTLGSDEEQRIFAENLRDLIHADLPCKIILVMREEYIGYLYYFEELLPEINDFRIRVEAMEDKRVAGVIQKSCAAFNITLEDKDKVPALIIDKLRGEERGDTGPRHRIQLPYLQVYLDGLYQHVLKQTHPATSKLDELPQPLPKMTFTAGHVEEYGSIENVLGDFLDSQVKRIQAAVKTAFPLSHKDSVKEALDQFVTVDGTKRPLYKEDVNLPKLKPEVIDMIIDELLEARILRPDGDRFELAHDALAFRISSQRSDEEKRFKEIVEFLKTKYDQYQRKLTGRLTGHEVALVRSHPKPNQIKEKLTRSEWHFFKKSENRVLVQRFLWAIGIFGVLLLLFLSSLGYNIYQGILLNEKDRKIAVQDSLIDRETRLSTELNILSGSPIDEAEIERVRDLIEKDSIEQAIDKIDEILLGLPNREEDPVGGGNSTPVTSPGVMSCDSLILLAETALDEDPEDPCLHGDTFQAFQNAYEADRCADFPKMETIWERVQSLSGDFIERGDDISFSSNADPAEVKEMYQKASCLLPNNDRIQELIRRTGE